MDNPAPMLTAEDVDRLATFAKNHPFLTSVLLGALLVATVSIFFLLFIGTLASYVDDTKLSSARLAAAVRLGRHVGTVFKGSGYDIAILLFGEAFVRKEEAKTEGSGEPPGSV